MFESSNLKFQILILALQPRICSHILCFLPERIQFLHELNAVAACFVGLARLGGQIALPCNG